MSTYRKQVWSGVSSWNHDPGVCSVCGIVLNAGDDMVTETTIDQMVGLDERFGGAEAILNYFCMECGTQAAANEDKDVVRRPAPEAVSFGEIRQRYDAAKAAEKAAKAEAPKKKGRLSK